MTNERKRRQQQAVSRLSRARTRLCDADELVWSVATTEGVEVKDVGLLREVLRQMKKAYNQLTALQSRWTKL